MSGGGRCIGACYSWNSLAARGGFEGSALNSRPDGVLRRFQAPPLRLRWGEIEHRPRPFGHRFAALRKPGRFWRRVCNPPGLLEAVMVDATWAICRQAYRHPLRTRAGGARTGHVYAALRGRLLAQHDVWISWGFVMRLPISTVRSAERAHSCRGKSNGWWIWLMQGRAGLPRRDLLLPRKDVTTGEHGPWSG